MPNTAVVWIRDGVLVDRMHINSVAFAFAVLSCSPPEVRQNTTLEDLINFGFEKSGLSCADKIRLYNSERENIVADVERAAGCYNQLAREAATTATYFRGAVELLSDLHRSGVFNFITSAVEQDILDLWSDSEQGKIIAPFLQEILGKRQGFGKGRDHFNYVFQQLTQPTIYYVADAITEIEAGNRYSREYNISSVGFAHVITADRVREAVGLVSAALERCRPGIDTFALRSAALQFDREKISLPGQVEIEADLSRAGATSVIGGEVGQIMPNLRQYFVQRRVLNL